MDKDLIFDLVVEAVAKAQTTHIGQSYFSRSTENGLANVPTSHVWYALKRLRDQERVISASIPGDPVERNKRILGTITTDKKTGKTVLIPPNRKQGHESSTNDPLETLLGEFLFWKKESFKNWYAAYQLRKKSSFDNLSLVNLEKIKITLLDIDEKLQINPGEMVTISNDYIGPDVPVEWNHSSRSDHRCEILSYLKNRKIISHFGQSVFDGAMVTVNIENFFPFKASFMKYYESKQKPPRVEVESASDYLTRTIKEKFFQPRTRGSTKKNGLVYEIEFREAGEILLNGLLISRLRWQSENFFVFKYLHENSNKLIPLKDIQKAAGGALTKDLHKIVENLGFSGDLKKVFFKVSKTEIEFRNPITREALDSHNVEWIRFPRR